MQKRVIRGSLTVSCASARQKFTGLGALLHVSDGCAHPVKRSLSTNYGKRANHLQTELTS